MKVVHSIVIAGIFLCVGVPSAFANTTNLSTDPSYARMPFGARCAGVNSSLYQRFYRPNYHYTPVSGPCVYTVPASLTGKVRIALYEGVAGDSRSLGGDQLIGAPTLAQRDLIIFGSPPEDQDYFFVIYQTDINHDNAFADYLANGGNAPEGAVEGDSYYLLPWKWGEKPPEEFDPVVIIPGILGSWEKNGEWVLDPVLQTYDNLINTLLANGYVEGKTLFTFPYDWKNSNITTAFLLKQKIEEIKQVCACEWVDIISHSMGGLVALQYIVRDDYARDVDQLVMIATPLMGAPKAYKTWEGGVIDFGNKLRNAIMSVIFYNEARENGYGNIFDYIRGWPAVSIQELLPVNHNYLSTATTTLEYPNGYPGNLFLETLHTDLITTLLNGVEPLLIRADNLTDSTINGFVVEPSDDPDKWEHGKPVSEVLGPGDGTVPSWSTEEFIGSSVVFAGMDHSVVASSSVSWIFSELNERPVETIVGEKPDVNGSFLFFQLFSPVDMQIVAPDGKRFGKDFVSNTEIAEIPNAFYSGFEGENEYAIILNPLPGEYEVNTIGTEEGEYTIAVDYSNLATTTRAEVRGIAVLGEVIEHTATVSATSTDIEIEKVEEESSSKTCQENVDTARDSGQINQITVYYYLVAECQVVEALSRAREYIPEPADNILRKIIERTTNNIQEHVRGRDKHDGRFR